jgi:hypothetical protein
MQEFRLDRNGFRMASILKLYLDIALLRRGPEDVPASKSLLYATLAAFVVLNALLTVAFRPTVENWLPQLLVSVAFTLFWYRILLTLFGRRERYLQTMTAVLGFGCIITPVLLPAVGAMAPYMEAPQPDQAMPFIVLLMLPLFIYLLYVSARILRAAIERPMFQCVMLVLLQTFLEPLLLLALFGPGAAAAAAAGAGG